MQCDNRRFELVKIEPDINEIKEYIDTVKRAAKEIERREKSLERALEDHLKNEKLTQEEIDEIKGRGPVF